MTDHDVEAVQGQPQPLTDQSDGRIWSMLESAPDGMVLTDDHGVILVVNRQVEVLFGYDRGELLGRSIETLIPERHRSVHQAHRTRYRVDPKVRAMGADVEFWARRKDGSEFPVEVSLSPIQDDAGTTVVASVRDITERMQAAAHTHIIQAAIDAAHDGVYMFDAETMRFTHVNQGAIDQTGYSRAELMTMTPVHIKPEFTVESFRSTIEPLITGATSRLNFRTMHRHKSGRDIPVEIVLEYPPAVASSAQRVLVALARDVTDRIEAEHRIESSEQAFRTAFEHAPAGMVIARVDDDGTHTIERVNQSLCDMLRCASDELIGLDLAILAHPHDTGHFQSTSDREVRYQRSDGSFVWTSSDSSVLSHDGGTRVLLQIVDRTEHRAARTERARAALLEDRERIGRDLHDLVIQRLFAAGMGLQSVIPQVSPPAAVDRIQSTIDELDATIRELRSAIFGLSATDAPDLVMQQLRATVEAHVGVLGFRPTFATRGDVESVPNVVLEQMIPSLTEALSNVCRHARATSVDVSVVATTTELVLTVADDGVGLDPQRVRGNGLGNLESRAQRVGGTCSVETRAEGGTCLTWSARL